MAKDTQNKLSHITIALHWVVGLTIITLLAVGIYMANTSTYSLYPIHKSVGVSIFVVIILRVIWRIYNGWPEPTSNYKKWEQSLSKFIHYTLLIGTILIPLSGMIMSGMGGHGIAVFGFELFHHNPDPLNPNKVIPFNADMAQLGSLLHEWVSYIVIAALALHIAGALKHHIIDGDGTLKRMLGKEIK
tara:strand:- start:2249 stop:2812 length:564 start_codon:yes stop_codon:yes gene_type:complete